MPAVKDITGKKFGHWTVIQRAQNDKSGNRRWLCRCSCGTEKIVYGGHLAAGRSQSCGCIRDADTGRRGMVHGMAGSRTYRIWSGMKYRCQNPKCPAFANYGGRGITVCDEWQHFEKFLADMGVAPKNKTLDRIDNNDGYYKENCRWASRKRQNNNRRDNRILTLGDVSLNMTQWSEKTGIAEGTIRKRLKLGWSVDSALTIPSRKKSNATGS